MAGFRIIVAEENFKTGFVRIFPDRLHHLRDVLRVRSGDIGEIILSESRVLEVRVLEIQDNGIAIELLCERTLEDREGPQLSLVQALPKGDKMSEIFRMCSEIGVQEFFPVISQRSVSVPKDGAKKIARWQKVIDSAALQSQQCAIPILGPILGFQDFLKSFAFDDYDLKLVLWEEETNSLASVLSQFDSPQKILVFVGPEGGLRSSEVDLLQKEGFLSASLGRSILRVEHAGFFGMAQLLYKYG